MGVTLSFISSYFNALNDTVLQQIKHFTLRAWFFFILKIMKINIFMFCPLLVTVTVISRVLLYFLMQWLNAVAVVPSCLLKSRVAKVQSLDFKSSGLSQWWNCFKDKCTQICQYFASFFNVLSQNLFSLVKFWQNGNQNCLKKSTTTACWTW